MASDEIPLVKAIANYRPPPLNKDTALNYYAPAFGTFNYAFLSINVMNPGLLQRVLPKPDLTNIFLFNSCFGSFLFIAGRPHLSEAPFKLRIAYSVYGSILFNMGSVLSWAILRSLLPNNSGLTTVAGLISGFALTGCGVAYLSYNDKIVKANKK
ncbi:uncharacterized protein LOC132922360 [Rhopalosiphum padi]|uniref:uncharacterized protein LOC132922360 n=1 Tax=Rhopalosiphum padi TaxID=40932 RepID=UPI00298E9504|nr:uncharacterized protein LOC132922360 [Rhopalosiphum padi]